MRAVAAASTPWPGGITYAAPGNPGIHDDDPVLGPHPTNACSSSGGAASQPSGATHLAQVRPNAGDRPGKRTVELWSLVRTNGAPAPSLSWRISVGDAGIVAAVPGQLLPTSECLTLGAPGMAGTMLDAAAATGQVSEPTAGDPRDGVAARCLRGDVAVFRGTFALSFLADCGSYRVEAVIGTSSAPALWSSFDDQCFTAVARDFDSVSWGKVVAGQEQWVRGDLSWSEPRGMQPTLMNEGNVPARLSIAFEALVPSDASSTGTGRIEAFDACIGKSATVAVCQADLGAGAIADFGRAAAAVLCPGEMARLDVGILPGTGIAAGGYSGVLRIADSPSPGACPPASGG